VVEDIDHDHYGGEDYEDREDPALGLTLGGDRVTESPVLFAGALATSSLPLQLRNRRAQKPGAAIAASPEAPRSVGE
jgi:hypothetical protein